MRFLESHGTKNIVISSEGTLASTDVHRQDTFLESIYSGGRQSL